jgi:hypothetical protein
MLGPCGATLQLEKKAAERTLREHGGVVSAALEAQLYVWPTGVPQTLDENFADEYLEPLWPPLTKKKPPPPAAPAASAQSAVAGGGGGDGGGSTASSSSGKKGKKKK